MARLPSTREIPPPLELECLRVLWDVGEASAAQVRETLQAKRPLAYTTVLTLLERLVRRELVTRRKVGRSFVYASAQNRELMRRAAVRQVLDLFFDGSSRSLTVWLHEFSNEHTPAPLSVEAPRLDASLL